MAERAAPGRAAHHHDSEQPVAVTYSEVVKLLVRAVGTTVGVLLAMLSGVYWYEHQRIDQVERAVISTLPKDFESAIASVRSSIAVVREDIATLKAQGVGQTAQIDRVLDRLERLQQQIAAGGRQ